MGFDNYEFDFGVMPRVSTAANDSSSETLMTARRALVKRHLRSELILGRDGLYSHLNMCNLSEVILHVLAFPNCGEHAEVSDVCTGVKRSANEYLRSRESCPFEEFQTKGWLTKMLPIQFEALVEALASCNADIEPLTLQEKCRITAADGADHFVARDATIKRKIWEAKCGMTPNRPTDIVVSSLDNQLNWINSISALDDELCTGSVTAAIKQVLSCPVSGRYQYFVASDGSFTVRVFNSRDVDLVRGLLRARGFSAVSSHTLPYTAEQRLRFEKTN